jgi:hypothetical protein
MKYFLSISFMVIIFFMMLFVAQKVQAFALLIPPHGGNITSTTYADVTCTGGTGPVSQRSAGSSPSSYYVYPFGSTPPPQTNKWVLGLYNRVPSFTDCWRQVGPYRYPFQVYKVKLWGTSGSF